MRTSVALLSSIVLFAACGSPDVATDDTGASDTGDPEDVPFVIDERPVTQFVNPFLGTDGSGNVLPGALVPHGFVRATPDTRSESLSIDAYDWDDELFEGITHTGLEGPGGSGNGYAQILFLPQAGERVLDADDRDVPFSHDDESAKPGYYAVGLPGGVELELTATGHAAVHRYTLPAGPSRILVDLGHSNGVSKGGHLEIDGDVLRGHGVYEVHPIAGALTGNDGRTAWTTVYLYAELGLTPEETGTFVGRDDPTPNVGATTVDGAWAGGWVGWDLEAPTTFEVRVGISLISEDHARANLEAEVGDDDFDAVAAAADAAWNTRLNRIQFDSDEPEVLTQAYTALYHSMFQPADHTESGGVFSTGYSGEHVTREADGFRYLADDWCMWDTYRTSHPLFSLTEPEWRDDYARSLLVMYEEGGWLPKCTWSATSYSRVMTGNPAVIILSDLYTKGFDRFDTELAWEAIDHAGMDEVDPLFDAICGYVNQGTPPEYVANGFVSIECDPTQGASMTMEHAQADFAAARFAERMGRTADAKRYDARADNWKHHWDPSTGFVRGLHRDGSWRDPFDPADRGDANDFVEASAWIFSFFVPHDVPALSEAMGGDAAMRAKLDAFFEGGHFDPSNQPSFHIPWLYAHAGDPSATQAAIRELLDTRYGDGPNGLPGNDDAGSTSAFALLSFLGLYPLNPSEPVWTLGAPRVRKAVLHLHPGFYEGGTFTIEAVGDPATQPYVQSMTLNGEPWDVPTLPHDRIAAGGVLKVTLGDAPSSWGRGSVD